MECDVWIPAARPDVVAEANVGRLKTRLVAQGANIPLTPGAEHALAERGVLVLPDFIANAGGVIAAAVEVRGGTAEDAFAAIERKIRANVEQVVTAARERGMLPRDAAVALATERVRAAQRYGRWR
jgi:glutamate dehydrogenase/leucine dehydrogenase